MNKMYQHNIQLKEYNSFRTEALANVFCEPQNIDELKQCLEDHKNIPKLILGKGCNLFFTKNYKGLVIKLNMYGIDEKLKAENSYSEDIYIEAKASEDWDCFVEYCVNKNYSGLENLSYIPGTVGASPIQNIGAYGTEVKNCIHKVITLDTETLEVKEFSNEDCKFAYRDSIFKQTNKYIVLSVIYRLKHTFTYQPKYADLMNELNPETQPTLKEVREAIIRIRKRKLPDENELPNCGSFFKNPYITKDLVDKIIQIYPDLPIYPINEDILKTSAAFLIDKVGFKGKRSGMIGTYPKQALIVVNYGSPNGNDIVNFMHEIQEAVFQKFEITLTPEVRIL